MRSARFQGQDFTPFTLVFQEQMRAKPSPSIAHNVRMVETEKVVCPNNRACSLLRPGIGTKNREEALRINRLIH
jgi:hypothetical protein